MDRFGSRKLIFSGVICVGFGLILLSFTRSLFMFYGAFLLLGFGAGGCTSIVTMTAVGNWFKKNVGIAFGLLSAGFGASGLLIPLIVWLIDVVHWGTTLIILGLGMWGMGIPLSFVVRDKPEAYGYLPDGEIAPEATFPKERQIEIPIPFKEALKNKYFLFLNIAEVVRMMLVTAVVTHAMPYLGSIGMPRSTASLVVAGIPLASIIGRVGFGWLADHYPKKQIFVFFLFTHGNGFVYILFSSTIGDDFLLPLYFSAQFWWIYGTAGSNPSRIFWQGHFRQDVRDCYGKCFFRRYNWANFGRFCFR